MPQQFDPTKLVSILQTIAQDAPALANAIAQVLTDLSGLFQKQRQAHAAKPVACGPNQDCDCCHVTDALIEQQVNALALAVHLKCCCLPKPPDQD